MYKVNEFLFHLFAVDPHDSLLSLALAPGANIASLAGACTELAGPPSAVMMMAPQLYGHPQ